MSGPGDPVTAWRCALPTPPADWPRVEVWALPHLPVADAHEPAGREAARQRVRDWLVQHASPDIAVPFAGTPRSAPGASRVSVSHERDVSWIAWCDRGCLGIDAVDLGGLASVAASDLIETASHYLGRGCAEALGRLATANEVRRHFADAWARHEARLKCAGWVLDEWSAAVDARASACATAAVEMPLGCGGSPARWTARVAWRA